jgi:hypothetical protein
MTTRQAQSATNQILDDIRALVRVRDRLLLRGARGERLRVTRERLARRQWDLARVASATVVDDVAA